MNEFLSFNKMLTPIIIKAIFIVGCALSVLAGLVMFYVSISEVDSFLMIMSIVIIIVGPVAMRITIELMIVLFKMHEYLRIIAKYKNTGLVLNSTTLSSLSQKE